MSNIPMWYLITPLILFLLLIPGGFFMFRSMLRKVLPAKETRENQG